MPWPIQVLGIENSLADTEGAFDQSVVGLSLGSDEEEYLAQTGVPEVAGASIAVGPASSEGKVLGETDGGNSEVVNEGMAEDGIVGEGANIGVVDPKKRDLRFVFTLFGLANMGVGVTVARLVMKV
jgi:hypothetical protein